MSDFEIKNGVLIRYHGTDRDVTIPDGVTVICEDAFRYRHLYLTSITIPDGVTAIERKTFDKCSCLRNVTIPGSVKTIGYAAFSGCGFTNVTFPEGLTTIDEKAFEYCRSLTSVTIPKSVTTIGECAFGDCWKLTSITIPDSVTAVGKNAFAKCSNLKNITIPGRFAKQSIIGTLSSNAAIHVADISEVSTKYRPLCAISFAKDKRDCTDENGKKYIKYIKANAAELIGVAMKHPALFYLMVREKLILAKDLDAVTNAVQAYGKAEYIAAMLEYGSRSVSEKDKAKAAQKKEERDENVTSFIFDAEKLEKLQGKKFVVTGKLKTFVSRDEFRECLESCGAVLTEKLDATVDYLITNTPDSGTAKNKAAVALNIPRITEAEFNEMIGRKNRSDE